MNYIDIKLDEIRIAKLIGRPKIEIQKMQQELDKLIDKDCYGM